MCTHRDEFLYVLFGDVTFYADGQVFSAAAGECIFLPRGTPHAFLVASEEVHSIVFITTGGFLDAVNKMIAPAVRMEVPTDADTVTYANADLTETFKVF